MQARGYVVVFSRAGGFIVTANLAYTVALDIGYSFGGPELFRISELHCIYDALYFCPTSVYLKKLFLQLLCTLAKFANYFVYKKIQNVMLIQTSSRLNKSSLVNFLKKLC